VSNNKEAKVGGRYFYHKHEKYFQPAAGDTLVQEKLLSLCEEISGILFPDYYGFSVSPCFLWFLVSTFFNTYLCYISK
jgi:hypothetical protein